MTTIEPTRYVSNFGENQPPADLLGWCHQCGTIQAGSDARHASLWWKREVGDSELTWCCTTPGCDEPWGVGVWPGSPCPSCLPEAIAQAAAKVENWNGICRAVEYRQNDCETGQPTSARSAPA